MDYNSRWLIKLIVILSLSLLTQVLGLSYFASILLNMFLFASAVLVGTVGGVLIGTLTPVIAISIGLLPDGLMPLLPFVIGGNIALVVIYNYLGQKGKLLSMGIASFIRFTILSSGVRYLSNLSEEVSNMMQVAQLATALAGGLLSLLLIVLIVKVDNDYLRLMPNQQT